MSALLADLQSALGADRARAEPLELALYSRDAGVARGRAAVVCFPQTSVDVVQAVRIAALLIQPVMPDSASKLLDLLGQSQEQRSFAAIGARLEPGTALPAPAGVFPRYQLD